MEDTGIHKSRYYSSEMEEPDTCHDVFLQQPLKDNDLSFLQPSAARFTRCYQTFRKLSAGNPESTLKGHKFKGYLRLYFYRSSPLNMKTLS